MGFERSNNNGCYSIYCIHVKCEVAKCTWTNGNHAQFQCVVEYVDGVYWHFELVMIKAQMPSSHHCVATSIAKFYLLRQSESVLCYIPKIYINQIKSHAIANAWEVYSEPNVVWW